MFHHHDDFKLNESGIVALTVKVIFSSIQISDSLFYITVNLVNLNSIKSLFNTNVKAMTFVLHARNLEAKTLSEVTE